MEKRITFQAGEYEIEGLLDSISQDKGVIVTHPHPLYGGDMYNYVVESVVNAYQKKGYTTLRFNFRGTGKSQGDYSEGIGEQEDVRAAISWLSAQGIKEIDLAGYSFGAWVNAHIDCESQGIRHMLMVSPPVNFLNFDGIKALPLLRLVICGDDDEFASTDLLGKMISVWNPDADFKIIDNTDHFYGLKIRDIERILKEHLESL